LAGAGTLVHYGDEKDARGAMTLQFDAGRGTTMRLSQLDIFPGQLDAIFFTHMHSDHTEGFAELVQLRWMLRGHGQAPPASSAWSPYGGVDEAGLPGFYMTAWEAIWVPRDTPKRIIDKLNAAVVDALATPAVASRLTEIGQEIFPRDQQSPDALAALHKADLKKWWPIIKAADIKAEWMPTGRHPPAPDLQRTELGSRRSRTW
jgi:ribonuclease BN (tRNA processing enzyme)